MAQRADRRTRYAGVIKTLQDMEHGPLKVFIGYDSREHDAYEVCRYSLQRHATIEVQVFPLRQAILRELGLYARAEDAGAATEFSLTRFLTPYLAASGGPSMFVDCDFLFTADLARLMAQRERHKAVHVVKHDYTPRQSSKMDGRPQASYPRKNWSSLMIFEGSHPAVEALRPDVVNHETAASLHRLTWVDDHLIGDLSPDWNFLVGEYDPPAQPPAGIHFTNGGPWFSNCRTMPYAERWFAELDAAVSHGAGSDPTFSKT